MDLDMLLPGTAFIEKPFSPEELASKVREVLVSSKDGNGSGHVTQEQAPSNGKAL
jgi:DNA-binding response OmpR family regulator